jgi:hypothetical protein
MEREHIRSATLAIAALAGAIGCGSPPLPDAVDSSAGQTDAAAPPGRSLPEAPFASGSRLRAHYFETPGGRLFIDFKDTRLGISCKFGTAGDGRIRCLPVDRMAIGYSDAACTRPIGAHQKYRCGGLRPFYISRIAPDACVTGAAAESPAYLLGAPRFDTQYFTLDDAGRCTAQPTPPNVDTFDLTPVDPTTLAAASEVHPAAEGLAVRVLLGDDGAQEVVGPLLDAAGGRQCLRLGLAAPATTQPCLPLPFAFGDGFADAHCALPAATIAAECGAPGIAVVAAGTGCAPTWSLFSVGGRLANLYGGDPGSCALTAPSPGQAAYALGAALAPNAFPIVSAAPVGPGSPSVVVDTTASGRPLWTNGFLVLDDRHPTLCNAVAAVDGTLRCVAPGLPALRGDDALFADAACTQPIVDAAPVGCDTALPALGYRTAHAVASCLDNRMLSTFAIGAPLSPQTIYSNRAGGCDAMPASPSAHYHAVGATMPLSALPQVVEKTD